MEYNKKDQLGKRLLSSSGGSGSRTSSATMNDRLAELKKGAPQAIDVDDANETAATAQGHIAPHAHKRVADLEKILGKGK